MCYPNLPKDSGVDGQEARDVTDGDRDGKVQEGVVDDLRSKCGGGIVVVS
jgi:hypothetical protein